MTSKKIIAFTFLLLVLLSSCRDNMVNETKLDQIMETEHYVYHFTAGDEIDTTFQEAYYNWLLDTLDLSLTSKLHYYKYTDRDHILRATGKNTNGFAELGTYNFHTIWKADNHEMVHTVITQKVGHPVALFNEGIAVAHQANYSDFPDFIPGWNGSDFDQIAKNNLSSIPPLSSLLTSQSFFSHSQQLTYPISGSFVRYMIDKHGLEAMKSFISKSNFYDSSEETIGKFRTTYDQDLESYWNEWLSYIESQ